ncbi:MAG: DNA-3-methyladenine glycosylase 2 family protein [Phycisphaerae bacterium]|nr:DNA-3-methyladenine glycosylase 2 family protein [Phycisphaerae bacterium]
MPTSADACYAALRARDRRYDGAIYVGVRSTRIYCRPVCPARTPRRSQCTFFPSAALAERAGYRPCLRCRPEVAPRLASPIDGDPLAHLAALHLERCAHQLDDSAIESVAGRLGCTSRHLRRAVVAALGVTPIEIVQTARLLTAKRLLTDTALPVIDVAFAAGFGSVRRMNDLFRRRYRMTPSDLRVAPKGTGDVSPDAARARCGARFHLAYRPPLAWDALLVHLSHRAIPGVETVLFDEAAPLGAPPRGTPRSSSSAADERRPVAYRRVLTVEGDLRRGSAIGWIDVQNDAAQCRLLVTLSDALVPHAPTVLTRVRALFDLDASPLAIDAHLSRDARLAPSVALTPGLRVPGAYDGFELAWRTIVGQQISVKSASTVAGAIAARAGMAVETPWPDLRLATPTPAALADLSEREYRAAGLIQPRIDAIRSLAGAVAQGTISFDRAMDMPALARQLLAIRGVGPWTVSYLEMRALRHPDAFPYDDLVLRRALASTRRRDALAETASWSPWRSYAAMHLWRSASAPASARSRERDSAATNSPSAPRTNRPDLRRDASATGVGRTKRRSTPKGSA